MKIIINHSSMIPIYEQIVEQVKALIRNGKLKENDNLPSVRSLAKELKISDKLKRKIDIIGRFTNTTPIINNGSIKNITGTNVAYVMPHIIVIKNNKYLMFDECDDVYVNTFKNKIVFKDLEDYINSH